MDAVARRAQVHQEATAQESQRRCADAYRRVWGRYEDFTYRLLALMGNLLKDADIDIVQVDARPKSVDSFLDKLRRKGEQYDDPLEQMTDLVGLRVITYYLEDVSRVGDLINHEFVLDAENSVDKADAVGPDQFGYRSVHYVARLGPNRQGLAEWQPFGDICFEVQVRTSLQHAWAAVDHKLRYKTENDVPNHLKRRLYRLSALFEFADEQFSALRDASERVRQNDATQLEEGNLKIPVDADSLAAYLSSSDKFGALTERAGRRDDPRFAAHAEAARRDLLEELHALRVETIEEFDSLLRRVIEADPGFIERYSKQVVIMPHQILALAIGNLRREERGGGRSRRRPSGLPAASAVRAPKESAMAGMGSPRR